MSAHRRRLLAAVATLIVSGCVTGCTVSGTPTADPTDLTAATSTAPDTSSPGGDGPGGLASEPTNLPAAPANATTMVCSQYHTFDQPVQQSIVKANGVTKNIVLMSTLVSITCYDNGNESVATVVKNLQTAATTPFHP